MEGKKKKIDINKFGEEKWNMRMEGSEGKREKVGREKGERGRRETYQYIVLYDLLSYV